MIKRYIFLLFFVLGQFSISFAQVSAEDKDTPPTILRNKTSIENPMSLRDPFKSPIFKKIDNSQKVEGGVIRDGVYTNMGSPQFLTLNGIKILGVVVGQDRRAVATNKDSGGTTVKKETYLLREGMTIQNGKVELKAIIPGGVIFVEKITNVYGQTEYLETIVPISK